jgi:hypothetical protein
MPERRYSRYKRDDVWMQLLQRQEALQVTLIPQTASGSTVSLKCPDGTIHRAVILARSADWYYYSLNTYAHTLTCVVCGTHDSCLNLPVLAMDTGRWYAPKKIRDDFGKLEPQWEQASQPMTDRWEQARKTQYGHNILIGALMQERPDAIARLKTFKDSTRRRYEAKLKELHRRRVGHPLDI